MKITDYNEKMNSSIEATISLKIQGNTQGKNALEIKYSILECLRNKLRMDNVESFYDYSYGGALLHMLDILEIDIKDIKKSKYVPLPENGAENEK